MSEYLERFARQKIRVDGNVVEVLILGDGSDLPIGADLSDEMSRVGALLAYWGSVTADAIGEMARVDAAYRNFRATAKLAFLEQDPKLAEWKLNAKIEATDGFLQHKSAVALAKKNVRLCEAMVAGYEKKSNQLQSMGAKARAEINAQGIHTPTKEPGWNLSGRGSQHDDEDIPGPGKPSTQAAIERMKEINAAKKAAKKKPKSKDTGKKNVKTKKNKNRRKE